jgi:hypothetical protein
LRTSPKRMRRSKNNNKLKIETSKHSKKKSKLVSSSWLRKMNKQQVLSKKQLKARFCCLKPKI